MKLFKTKQILSNYISGCSLLSIILLFIYQFGFAQKDHIEFEHITNTEGLSQNTVFEILQDKYGFLWFATESGLNKYNGYEFTLYKIKLDNPFSISDNNILALYEDHLGNLWVGTDNGLNRFDTQNNGFIKYFYDHKNDSSICNNMIKDIVEDKYLNLWIATENGLSRYIRERNIFENYYKVPGDSNSLSSNFIYSIKSDKNGNLWIGTDNGLNVYKPLEKKFIHYNNHDKRLNGKRIISLTDDHEGNIWLGIDKENTLIKFDTQENRFYYYYFNPYSISGSMDNYASVIYEDKYHRIWVGTYNGLYRLDGTSFISYNHELNDLRSLNSDRLHALYEDKSGVFWIGTRGGGLNKFDNSKRKFEHINKEPGKNNSLCHNSIYSFYEDENNKIWIATLSGVSFYDLNTREYTNYVNDPNNENSLSNNQVWYVYKDSFGKVWICTEIGLNEFDPETKTFTRYFNNPADSTSLSHNTAYAILEDHKKDLWVGTLGGLNRFDRKNKKFIRYFNIPGDSSSITNNVVWNFWEDQFDTLWIASQNGLSKYNRKTNTFTQYFSDQKDPESISDNNISCFTEDNNGILWFGTNIGFNKYIREKNKFKYYSADDGLIDNVVYGMLVDDNNNLWMSSNSGISVYNQKLETFKNYNVFDGLQSNEFNFAHLKLKDGRMLFGGLEGFNIFHPDSILSNNIVPSIVFTNFKLFNKYIKVGEEIHGRVILKNTLQETEEIILRYDENIFTIEFAALHYVSPDRNQYAYKMDGINDDWEPINNRRFVPYTKVPPGNYVFRVTASNNDGIWNYEGASLKITIIPPFWKTLWFQISFIVFIAFLVYALILFRIRNLRLQKEKLEMLVEERTKELKESNATKDKFFSIISHDMKSPFNALLGFTEIMVENAGTLSREKILKFSNHMFSSAKQLYGLVENLLAWSCTKTNNIKNSPEPMNLNELVSNDVSLLSLNAIKKNINIVTDISNDIIVNVDANLISTVLRNLISNAIKFTQKGGEITILAEPMDDFVKVSVADSGVGIKKEDLEKLFREDVYYTTKGTDKEKGTGLGLILCKEFVEKIGGEISVESVEGKGTTFKFTIPKPV